MTSFCTCSLPSSSFSSLSSKRNGRVILNVGGKRYETTVHTLTKFADEEHYFIKLLSNSWSESQKDEIFIDRNGDRFSHVLDFLRDGEIFCENLKHKIEEILVEAKFFSLHSMQNLLQNRFEKLKHQELVDSHIKDLTIAECIKVSSSSSSTQSVNHTDVIVNSDAEISPSSIHSHYANTQNSFHLLSRSRLQSISRNHSRMSSECSRISDNQMNNSVASYVASQNVNNHYPASHNITSGCNTNEIMSNNNNNNIEDDIAFQCDRLRLINDDPSPLNSPTQSYNSNNFHTTHLDLGKQVFATDSDF